MSIPPAKQGWDFTNTMFYVKGRPVMPKMLTIDDAAEELGVSKRTLRRLISSGSLPAYRVGSQAIRIKPADLEKALKPVIPNGKP